MKQIITTILAFIFVFSASFSYTTVQAEAPGAPSFDELMQITFGDDTPDMMAIFMAESKLNPNAKNYNCEYPDPKDPNKKISTSCKKEDRPRAWSVDCGKPQINVRGRECPKELTEDIPALARAKKIYDEQGKEAWSVYNNGKYKEYKK